MNKLYTVLSNSLIAYETYQMVLYGDTSTITNPGQFINIKVDDSYQNFLRRPISICDYDKNKITIIYKVFGSGTKRLSKKRMLDTLDILSPLGNGFTVETKAIRQLLIGGGVGVPPLYGLAKQLHKQNISFDVVLGFNNKYDVFLEGMFRSLGAKVYVTTMDGSYGYKGNVLNLIQKKKISFDYYYACGPNSMLEAIVKQGWIGQLSFEERVGCGFGTCMGCSHETVDGYKRICKEGPVLESKEVVLHA